jgi:hypothetical protein
MRAFVRYDNKGIIVPTSFVMKKTVPKVGQWKEISTSKSVSGSPAESSQKNLRAFVRYNGKNKVVAGSIVLRGQVPTGNWSELTYDLSRPLVPEPTTTTTTTTTLILDSFILEMTFQASTLITIPLGGPNFSGYDFNCDWGDGTSTGQLVNSNGNLLEPQMTHTYQPGVYDITITGKFPYLYLWGNSSARSAVSDIKNWGTTQWESFAESFAGCFRLKNITSTDIPDLSRLRLSLGYSTTKQFFKTFRQCYLLENLDFMANWDMNGVELFEGTFDNSNQAMIDYSAIATWDMSTVTMIKGIFSQTSSSGFGSSKFNDAAAVHVANWDVSSVTDMERAFYNSEFLTTFPGSNWNVNNVTTMREMFWNTNALSDIEGLENWDISNVSDFFRFMNSSNTGLLTALYDSVLINWSQLNVQSIVNIDFGNSKYTSGGLAEASRQSLITNKSWTITDGGAV